MRWEVLSNMKAPVEILNDWMVSKFTNGLESFISDYISALPILLGVSIGVYALIAMMSKSLAKLGVVAVFLYGMIVVI